MIIWKGYGFLVLIIAVALGALAAYIFSISGSTEDLGAAVGALAASIPIWIIGKKLNAPEKIRSFVDKQTGQEVLIKPNHSLFFIKMQYWAFIIGGLGIIMLVDIYIHGKSSF